VCGTKNGIVKTKIFTSIDIKINTAIAERFEDFIYFPSSIFIFFIPIPGKTKEDPSGINPRILSDKNSSIGVT
jgi:hypothetical protein